MRSILLLTLCLVASQAWTQSCFITIGDSEVRSMTEDIQYIWLGTTEGLYRYNKGTELLSIWTSFNSALEEDHVRSVLSYQEDIYLCTDSSLYRFDTSSEQIFALNDSLSGQLAIGPQGQLILAADMDYYELLDDDIIYHQPLHEMVVFSCPICDHTTDIEVMENGEVWLSHFGFYQFDLLSFDGESWTVFDWSVDSEIFPIESWSDNRLSSKDNVLLSTSWGGLISKSQEEWEILDRHTDPQVIDGNDTLRLGHTGVTFDQNMGFWFGTEYDFENEGPGKLGYFDETNWHIVPLPFDNLLSITDLTASIFDPDQIFIGTTGGFLILDKSCLGITSGVVEQDTFAFKVFPNPSRDVLEFSGPVSGELCIYNSQGQKLFSKMLMNEWSIELPTLATGTHFLSIENDGDRFQIPIVID